MDSIEVRKALEIVGRHWPKAPCISETRAFQHDIVLRTNHTPRRLLVSPKFDPIIKVISNIIVIIIFLFILLSFRLFLLLRISHRLLLS